MGRRAWEDVSRRGSRLLLLLLERLSISSTGLFCWFDIFVISLPLFFGFELTCGISHRRCVDDDLVAGVKSLTPGDVRRCSEDQSQGFNL